MEGAVKRWNDKWDEFVGNGAGDCMIDFPMTGGTLFCTHPADYCFLLYIKFLFLTSGGAG